MKKSRIVCYWNMEIFTSCARKHNYYQTNESLISDIVQIVNVLCKTKVSEKDAFFFCYAARLLSIFIFKTSLVFSIVSLREVILQK